MMRSEQEIKELVKELSRLTGFIGEFGTEEEFQSDDLKFCNNAFDTLYWILGEISTERFRSDAYLNLAELKEVAREIETRTGRKLEEYE
jgi:hypothetical protein